MHPKTYTYFLTRREQIACARFAQLTLPPTQSLAWSYRTSIWREEPTNAITCCQSAESMVIADALHQVEPWPALHPAPCLHPHPAHQGTHALHFTRHPSSGLANPDCHLCCTDVPRLSTKSCRRPTAISHCFGNLLMFACNHGPRSRSQQQHRLQLGGKAQMATACYVVAHTSDLFWSAKFS